MPLRRTLLPALALLAASALPARAMEFHRVDDILVMSGPVVGDELVHLRDALAAGPIRLVLLHESPGGDLWNGYQVGNRIREEGLPTAVSGRCESACGLIFLGGKERFFSDGRPLAVTMVGLHGAHTTDTMKPVSELSPRMGWVIRTLTDGKYPNELLQRTIYPHDGQDIVYAFHPARFRNDGTSRGVIECLKQRDVSSFKCTMLDGLDALGIGVITSPELVKLPSGVKQLLDTLPAADAPH
jgi:hypothetical protein